MKNSLSVRALESACDLRHERHAADGSLRKAGATSSKLPPAANFGVEKRKSVPANFVNREDIRMIQTRRGLLRAESESAFHANQPRI
jgi:hypothetical protein